VLLVEFAQQTRPTAQPRSAASVLVFASALGGFDVSTSLDGEGVEHLIPNAVLIGLEEVFEAVPRLAGEFVFLFFELLRELVGEADEACLGFTHECGGVGVEIEHEGLVEIRDLSQILLSASAEETLDLIEPPIMEVVVRPKDGMRRQQFAPLTDELAHVDDLLEKCLGLRGGKVIGGLAHDDAVQNTTTRSWRGRMFLREKTRREGKGGGDEMWLVREVEVLLNQGMNKMSSPASEQHLQALAAHAEWEWMLTQVVEFRQRHGHEELGSHPAGLWLKEQRGLASAGKLSALKRQRLEECGITLPKAQLRRTKKVETVELPREDAAWERLYSRLDAWQAQHGHCEVPRAWAADPELARWVQDLKRLRAQRRLTRDQETRLEALGFLTRRKGSPQTALWEERYAEMVAFHAEHEHTNVPERVNKRLAFWRDTQREHRKKGGLGADRIARLDEIGFEWEAPGRAGRSREDWHEELWKAKLQELVAFKERFGHCHVPVLWEENRKLGGWVAGQRKRYREGRLEADRVTRLEALGFQWELPTRFFEPPFPTERAPNQVLRDLWERRYAEMTAFKKEHGHTNVREKQNKDLWSWRDVQREFRRKGKLSAERIARLDEIGFEWEAAQMAGMRREEAHAHAWEEKLRRLEAFRERFGHTQVPKKWEEDRELAEWVAGQRKLRRLGKLRSERETRLAALGFDWQPEELRRISPRKQLRPSASKEVLWDQHYAELVAFHEKHGHCLAPNKKPEVEALCKWCYSQRNLRRKGTLRADRVTRLEALGFRWDATATPGLSYEEMHEQRWERSFAQLLAFHARYGHAQVPAHWSEDVELGRWVDKQRQKAKKGRLSAEKRARLEALTFPWQPGNAPTTKPRPPQNFPKPAHDRVWQQHFAELCAFQQVQGHLRVPKSMAELNLWCRNQRKAQREGKLTLARREALDTIGFPWRV